MARRNKEGRHELENMRELPREFRADAQPLRDAGWQMVRGGKNHWLFLAPPPSKVRVSCPSTPGEGRSVQNTRADIRRAWRRWEAERAAAGS